jgi:hypothetical protein
MSARDDFLLVMRVGKEDACQTSVSGNPSTSAARAPSPQQAAASPPPCGAAAPPSCSHTFCEEPATNGDLCQHHFDLTADIRAEWESLRAEYEGDGWD